MYQKSFFLVSKTKRKYFLTVGLTIINLTASRLLGYVFQCPITLSKVQSYLICIAAHQMVQNLNCQVVSATT